MPVEDSPGEDSEFDNASDGGVSARADPGDGAGDAARAGGSSSGPKPVEEENENPQASAAAWVTETTRHVERVETITQSLLPDGSEETVRSTRTDETVRRTAVPHQAPGSAYPSPVG